MKWLVWLTFSLVPLFSEYRVYEMRILNKKTNQARTIYSTLDWIQYTDYHHLSRDEKIELVDHWMCWKRSEGEKPLCKRPVTADTLKSEKQEPEG